VSDQRVEDNTTRATARLPGLDIEVIHRRSLNDEAEQVSINLQAMPSFEAFGRFLESANPFALWAQAVQNGVAPVAQCCAFRDIFPKRFDASEAKLEWQRTRIRGVAVRSSSPGPLVAVCRPGQLT
jgi:hypothetical protein